jgi:SAM-dependent methyltransferase
VHGLDQLGGRRRYPAAGYRLRLRIRRSARRPRGAVVTGIDVSDALVKIAVARTAEGDFRVGDMFALPFPGASFDVATSFNGIWKGCDAALREAARVLVPGGRLGLTFWGRLEHVGLMPYFLKTIELSPPSHGEATIRQGHTGRARRDRADAGLGGLRAARARDRDGHIRVARCRARGPGTGCGRPSVPAIQAAGLGPFCQALRDVIEPFAHPPVPGSGSLRSSAGSPPNSDPLTPYLSAFAGPARPVSSPTPDVPGQPPSSITECDCMPSCGDSRSAVRCGERPIMPASSKGPE